MKKIVLIISILFFSISVKSQITKGYWMFGGDAIVRGYKFDNSTKFNYYAEIFPKVGYFISDKFVVGSEIGLFINKDNFHTSLAPFARYYFFNNEKILNPFIEGGFGLKRLSFKSDTKSINEFMSQLKIGTSIFFTNSVALNITLNYKHNSFNYKEELSIAFGFQIHLQKK